MSYTDVFGGETIFPSQLSFLLLTISADTQLQWPTEQQIAGINTVADFLNINAAAGSLNLILPSALNTATGNKTTINNVGANTFVVEDSTGGVVQTIQPGEVWVIVLTNNSSAAGTWTTFQMGASVSVASASALAGFGLKAIGSTLNERIDSSVKSTTPFSAVSGDRARCLIYTAGAGTCNLPNAGTVGADWFFMLRNSGSGTLNVLPPAGLIDGSASINLSPNISCFIFTDGTNFFTIGLATASTIAFDFVSIPVPGSGDFTLSGANLNRVSYRFTGALTGNRRIVVPNTTQQYWVDNETTGAFALTVSTAAQVGPPTITQGQTAILYCDSVNVINATNSSAVVFPITIGQGGTGANTAPNALTNLGIPTPFSVANGGTGAANAAGAQANLGVPPTARLISTGSGLTGGGDLSADRTLVVDRATVTPTDGVGYLDIPQNSQSVNYTLVIGDRGKHIYHPSGGGAGDTFTIPANASVAFPIGTAVTFINGDTNAVSIAITTDTMTLAGTTSTGTRTLVQNGMATAIKITATAWIISGTGLS